MERKASVVSFLTNDKLKVFISEIQEKFKDILEATHEMREDRNYESILVTQYIIRQYLIKHQNRIDFFPAGLVLRDGHPKSMPSLFGLYMMCVSELSLINTIDDVMEQIEKRYLLHLGEFGLDAYQIVFNATELHEKKLCCCSHKCHIDNMWVIKNHYTNLNIVLGCDCIYKNNLIDRDVVLREQKKTPKYIEKKKIADKIKEDKKKAKEDEKKRIFELKIEAEKQAEIQKRIDKEINDRKIQEIIRANKEREEIEKLRLHTILEENKRKEQEKERLYVETHGRPSNDIRGFFGTIYNTPPVKIETIPVAIAILVEPTLYAPIVRTFTKNEKRTYLNVSYTNKDKAKAMGAFYDMNYKKWCIRACCRDPEGLLREYKVIPDPRI